jgi:hypothetical protein
MNAREYRIERDNAREQRDVAVRSFNKLKTIVLAYLDNSGMPYGVFEARAREAAK